MKKKSTSISLKQGEDWFVLNNWQPFPFQKSAWQAYLEGKDGIVNAPTGSGKTYSLLMPIVLEGLENKTKKGLQAIWITPIRALAKEIHISATRLIEGLGLEWKVGIRTGDTSQSERQRQKRKV